MRLRSDLELQLQSEMGCAPVPEHFVDLFPSPQLLFVLLEETAHGQCLPPGGKREGTSWGLSLKVHT